MSAHTPGPWKWEGFPGNSSLVGPEGKDDYVLLWAPYEGLSIMGRLEPTGWAGTEAANARLIAAAPDLLAACEEFVAKCDRGEAKSKRSYAQMRAAIAKATGVEP